MQRISLKAHWNVFKSSIEMTLKHNLIDGFVVFTIIVQPLLVALLALWMLRSKGAEYAIFVVVGSGMSGLWSSLLFVSGNTINVERWFGTLETLTGVPSPLQVVVLGKTFANVVQSVLSMIVTYLLASFIMGYPLSVALPLHFLVSLGLTIIAFISFGLIISSLFILNPQIQRWQNGIEFPVYILSGFLFPILMLPGWSRPLSYLLPTYWAARAMHASARASEPLSAIWFSWGVLAFCSLVYLLLSSSLFKVMINRAKRDATLDAR